MGQRLRVLLIEDAGVDGTQVVAELGKAGFETVSTRADSLPAVTRAVRDHSFDIAVIEPVAAEVDRRLTEARRLVHELEKLLSSRDAELREARALDRAKSRFVNAVSHELRIPLTTILGYAEFLEDELGGPLTTQQREYVSQIISSAMRQEKVVSDLLDYARQEAGSFRLRRQRLDFRHRLEETLEALTPTARRRKIRLEVAPMPEPLLLPFDAQRIGQVLNNLLENALKFSDLGGRVRVAAGWEGDRLRFEVHDDGPGIAQKDVPRLFQLFGQLENGARKGGTGLGLAISKTIVEAHGGDIGVDSEPGQGSTFWFHLPRYVPLEEVFEA